MSKDLWLTSRWSVSWREGEQKHTEWLDYHWDHRRCSLKAAGLLSAGNRWPNRWSESVCVYEHTCTLWDMSTIHISFFNLNPHKSLYVSNKYLLNQIRTQNWCKWPHTKSAQIMHMKPLFMLPCYANIKHLPSALWSILIALSINICWLCLTWIDSTTQPSVATSNLKQKPKWYFLHSGESKGLLGSVWCKVHH